MVEHKDQHAEQMPELSTAEMVQIHGGASALDAYLLRDGGCNGEDTSSASGGLGGATIINGVEKVR